MSTHPSSRGPAVTSAPAAGAVSRTPSAARTVIVSDVRLYREGLSLGLHACRDVSVIGTAATLEEARALLSDAAPTVVLLDVGMPAPLELARELLHAGMPVWVVGVAVADDDADVVACAEAGLSGFVLRNASIADVATAIRDVTLGELHCSARVSATLFKRMSTLVTGAGAAPAASPTASPLTMREREVIELVDRGLSNKQIAQRLRIGTATVKNHVHNILEKLHVRRRAEAAAQMRQKLAVGPRLTSRRHEPTTPI